MNPEQTLCEIVAVTHFKIAESDTDHADSRTDVFQRSYELLAAIVGATYGHDIATSVIEQWINDGCECVADAAKYVQTTARNAARVAALMPGVYVAGSHMSIVDGTRELVDLAESFGFVVDPADAAILADPTDSETEDGYVDASYVLHELANEAESWLNEHARPAGHHWLWHESDFVLWEYPTDDESETV